MEYIFSWSWFFAGLVIICAGAALTVWYRAISDNFGNGVASYDRYRMVGIIVCIVGMLVMLNLHTLILGAIFSMIFGRS